MEHIVIRPVSLRQGLALLCLASACKSTSTEPTFEPTGDIRTTATLGLRPYGLALSASEAFVTQLDGATVSRLSLSDLTSSGSAFAVGTVPTGAALSPDGSLLLVSNQADGNVTLLPTTGGAARTTFTTTGSPLRVLFSPDGARAYATTGAGYLVVIDVALRQAIASVSTGLGPINGIAFSPDGAALYLTSTYGGVVTVDARTNAIVRTYPLSGQLQEVVPSPERDKLYVADEYGGVIALSLTSGTVTRFAATNAFGLALSRDNSKLWATQPFLGMVTIIDRATGTSVRQLALGGLQSSVPRRVVFDRHGAAVVTDEGGFVHIFR